VQLLAWRRPDLVGAGTGRSRAWADDRRPAAPGPAGAPARPHGPAWWAARRRHYGEHRDAAGTARAARLFPDVTARTSRPYRMPSPRSRL